MFISYYRHLFFSYIDVQGGVVLMANNLSCKVVGVGSNRIKMFDGILHTLSIVRFVPFMKKNLISLGTFDNNGCKVNF